MVHWDSRVDVGTLVSLGTVLAALLAGSWRLFRRAERLVETVDALSQQLAALAESLRRHVERATGRMDLVELRLAALEAHALNRRCRRKEHKNERDLEAIRE